MKNPRPVAPAPARLSRERAATLLIENRDRFAALLRRRVRGKLAASLDLDDVLSSAFRRVDELSVRRVLRAHSPEQLWALILTIARNLALTRARAPLAQVQGLTGRSELPARDTLRAADERETNARIAQMTTSLTSVPDLELFLLRLHGLSDDEIGRASGTTTAAVHQRWVRLRRDLRRRFAHP